MNLREAVETSCLEQTPTVFGMKGFMVETWVNLLLVARF